MGKAEDLVGRRFGRLVVIRRVGVRNSSPLWECLCDCGNTHSVTTQKLKYNKSKSCGCYRIDLSRESLTEHGFSGTPIWKCWVNMRRRCTDERDVSYPNYGGKGVTYALEWDDFSCFLSDMGSTYFGGASLDRENPKGNYEPSNCRWVVPELQARSKSLQTNNKTGVTGVCLATGGKRYAASWQSLEGKQVTKYFYISEYGEEGAFRLACETRAAAILELNAQGAGYTEFHGK